MGLQSQRNFVSWCSIYGARVPQLQRKTQASTTLLGNLYLKKKEALNQGQQLAEAVGFKESKEMSICSLLTISELCKCNGQFIRKKHLEEKKKQPPQNHSYT